MENCSNSLTGPDSRNHLERYVEYICKLPNVIASGFYEAISQSNGKNEIASQKPLAMTLPMEYV
jgi:hypothetical protein